MFFKTGTPSYTNDTLRSSMLLPKCSSFLPAGLSSTVFFVFSTSSMRAMAALPFCILEKEVESALAGLMGGMGGGGRGGGGGMPDLASLMNNPQMMQMYVTCPGLSPYHSCHTCFLLDSGLVVKAHSIV